MGSLVLRNGIYYYKYSIKGKFHRKSLNTRDKEKAKLLKVSLDKQVEEKKTRAKVASLTIDVTSALSVNDDQDCFRWAKSRWGSLNSKERLAVIFVSFHGRCHYCGKEVSIPLRRESKNPKRAVMDHKNPHSGGGTDDFSNIVLACEACNMEKCDLSYEEFSNRKVAIF